MNNIQKLAAITGMVLTGCLYTHDVNKKEEQLLIKNSRNNVTKNISQNDTINVDNNKNFIRMTVDQIKYYSKYLIQATIMYNQLKEKADTHKLSEKEFNDMKELERQISFTQTWIKFNNECINIAQEEIAMGKPLNEKADSLLNQEEYQILFQKKEESIKSINI